MKETLHTRSIKKVAKCPHCKAPHDYIEVRFPVENDDGYWKLDCRSCEHEIVIKLKNPRESGAPHHISERREEPFAGSTDNVATDVVQHNFNPNDTMHRFNFDTEPIYVCEKTGQSLEAPARAALVQELDEIKTNYGNAVNHALKGGLPNYQYVVIHVDVPCECCVPHTATFYAKFLTNMQIQEGADEYLLAGISGSDLQERLDGLFSKSEVMTFLEKLIIRWHLIADQIIVATPFVGHQWLSKEDKLSTWTWLLSILDPKKSVFITRKMALDAYKAVLEEVDGLNHEVLAEYGLENKLISADVRKQDFHAKFFLGMTEDRCEVLSGSANLVFGPSIENTSFRTISATACREKYLAKINVTLPQKLEATKAFVLVRKVCGRWLSDESSGPRLA